MRASDVGMDVVYDGIRLTPGRYRRAGEAGAAHVVGLSILSGSHVSLVREVVQRLREAGLGDVPVVVGGIIPPDDVNMLKQCGAAAVYTPKDFQLNDIMTGIVGLVDAKAEALVQVSAPVPPLRAAREGAAVIRLACAAAFALLSRRRSGLRRRSTPLPARHHRLGQRQRDGGRQAGGAGR